ncbi:Bug family tripartite tricarboxylate transporter substrate binding protein [Paenibacillus naphthalenovorans]|uniref:Bug family tripartite tricarboxylate transporter substrate binding protein n=1 Tax=Paenibacillus naphthalenovorans TaxID=162209 RepID=UPI00088D24E0|nr:tripartite tricarboxylate transporter substrate binding protein [Paenibacillus naphthalenovorans]SDJ46318.1 Tripartite-type tricarboxylate transporter, receptor component TctC [Paenibacillus naphthalenovorans]
MQIGKSFLFTLLTGALVLGSAGCSNAPETKPTGAEQAAETQNKETKTDFPKKDIELVVGFAAGGGTDAVARIVANVANKYMPGGKSIVVSNKTGGSGTIALADILQSNADGYKIGSVTTGNLAIQPNYGKTPFQIDDFIPVARFNSAQNLLVVKADAPWKTYDEWLDWVKKNPGKFTYGTPGAGNTQHLTMEGINILEGIQTKHVPFDGAAPALTALLGGHVQGAVVLTQEAKPHVDSGTVRVLANAGTSKIEAFKDAVFLKDKGFVGLDTWSGVVVHKDTPKEVVDILREVFKKAMADPSIKEEFNRIGLEPAYADSKEFADIIAQTNKTTGDVAKSIGLIK